MFVHLSVPSANLASHWLDRRMDRRTGIHNLHMDKSTLYSTGHRLLWGHYPANFEIAIAIMMVRAREPLTILCLWETGSSYFVFMSTDAVEIQPVGRWNVLHSSIQSRGRFVFPFCFFFLFCFLSFFPFSWSFVRCFLKVVRLLLNLRGKTQGFRKASEKTKKIQEIEEKPISSKESGKGGPKGGWSRIHLLLCFCSDSFFFSSQFQDFQRFCFHLSFSICL